MVEMIIQNCRVILEAGSVEIFPLDGVEGTETKILERTLRICRYLHDEGFLTESKHEDL